MNTESNYIMTKDMFNMLKSVDGGQLVKQHVHLYMVLID